MTICKFLPFSTSEKQLWRYTRFILEQKLHCILIPLLDQRLMVIGHILSLFSPTSVASISDFNLRPLFFAYEDRAQIIRLIVETIQRLSITIKQEHPLITAKFLWEKITALMTEVQQNNSNLSTFHCISSASRIPLRLLTGLICQFLQKLKRKLNFASLWKQSTLQYAHFFVGKV